MTRPAEEIHADLATWAARETSWSWPTTVGGWMAMMHLAADVAPLLADRERLSAELADARAELDLLAEAAYEEHERSKAAERALEAVRAQVAAVEALIPGDGSEFAIFPSQLRAALGVTPGEYLLIPRAALSAASPTTSDEVATGDCVNCEKPMAEHHLRHHSAGCTLTCWPTASDEPARCPHGKGYAHWYADENGRPEICPGPAASGTPDGGQR